MTRRTPSKREALEILENVEERLSAIREDVKWASNLGFTPKVRPHQQVRTSGHGDSTGSTMLNQEMTRAQVKKIYAWVGKLDDVLDKLDDELAYLFRKADHRKDYEMEAPTGEHGKHPVRGALVTKAEIDKARTAKTQRTNRGEGYGVA